MVCAMRIPDERKLIPRQTVISFLIEGLQQGDDNMCAGDVANSQLLMDRSTLHDSQDE